MIKKITDKVYFKNGAKINNRIAMAPMQTSSAMKGGFISNDTLEYYNARSSAAGLLITEFHYVSKNGGPSYALGYPEQLAVYNNSYIQGLSKLAKVLKSDGNKAILQIHHAGRRANGWAISGETVLGASNENMTSSGYPVKEMSEIEILEVIDDFGEAVKRAIEAGFDGVEIHGANHYLLQQFFSENTNRRKDQWGGTLENRMRFPLQVVRKVKEVVNKSHVEDFIIGYRISPEEIHGDNIGYTFKESKELVKKVVNEEIDYIHLSLWDGYNSKPMDNNKSYAQIFREVMDKDTILITVGGVLNESSAIDAIENYSDIIAVGRGTLIDPQFAKKIEDNQGGLIFSEINEENIDYVKWTPGLLESFSRKDSLGLPKIPGGESIEHLHTGKFDMLTKNNN